MSNGETMDWNVTWVTCIVVVVVVVIVCLELKIWIFFLIVCYPFGLFYKLRKYWKLEIKMSVSGEKSTPSSVVRSSQGSRPTTVSAWSNDPTWPHAYAVERKKNHTICIYCNKWIRGGGITRLKEHLVGIQGDTQPCENVSNDIRWRMQRLIQENKKE